MAQANSDTGTLLSSIFIKHHLTTTFHFGVIYTKVRISSFGECIVNDSHHKICLSVVAPTSGPRLFGMVIMQACINLRRDLIACSNLEHFTLFSISSHKTTVG